MEIKTPPEIHGYAYHTCRAWYNGFYTMATKPIKFLEFHYTMTQFLIKGFIALRVKEEKKRVITFKSGFQPPDLHD